MKLDRANGLMAGARQVLSPNADDRPAGAEVEILIVHAISLPPGQYGGPGVEQLFCNCLPAGEHPFYRAIADLRVSSHFFIRRDGELVQFVPVNRRAWHAGKSFCEGRERVNDFSIGIELEGDDEHPFENPQYDTLTALTRALITAYPAITPYRIYGHSDIAPGRKTDPGPHFDWRRYRQALPRPG